jgi:Ulp1 family protease
MDECIRCKCTTYDHTNQHWLLVFTQRPSFQIQWYDSIANFKSGMRNTIVKRIHDFSLQALTWLMGYQFASQTAEVLAAPLLTVGSGTDDTPRQSE